MFSAVRDFALPLMMEYASPAGALALIEDVIHNREGRQVVVLHSPESLDAAADALADAYDLRRDTFLG